ncbi:MAG: antitoxin, partial [Microvirga sp.]
MTTAKVFKSGNSQAVRLPKEFRFASDEVEIFRRGDEVVLREKPRTLTEAINAWCELPDDAFADLETIEDSPPQVRKG